MGVNLMGLGLQGLLTTKQSLDTVGHNIANVNTEGYSRQTTIINTAGAQQFGGASFGLGVKTEDVIRTFDQFAYQDLRGNTSNLSYNQAFLESVTRVDQVISDDDTSITNSLALFFAAQNGVADNPNSLEARNNLIQISHNMTSTFNRLHDQLDIQFRAVNDSIENAANEMTALAANLAEVNRQVQLTWGDGKNHLPNDLLDQRDTLVLKLSEFTNVSTVQADNGMISLFIGSGQPLVLGSRALTVNAIPDRTDNTKMELALNNDGVLQRIRGDLTGGKVQAISDFRTNVLEPAFNRLGQTAIGIGHAINEQQQLGLDLNLQVGGNFFNDVNDPNVAIQRALPTSDGLGTAELAVQIEDISALTADDFQLEVLSYAAGPPETVQFQLTNLTDGSQVTLPAAGPQDLTVSRNIAVGQYGFSIDVNSVSVADPLQAGKTFELRPTRLGAQKFTAEIVDPALVAAAANQILITDGATNTGASITRISQLNNPNDVNFPTPEDVTTNPVTPARGLRIEINEPVAGTFTYQILNANTGVPIEEPVGTPLTGLPFTPPLQTLSHAGFDIDIQIQDTAALDSYSFTLDYNETGVGNNTNALVIAAFQTDKILNQGRSTFQDNYALLTSNVGSATNSSEIRVQSSEVLFNQAESRVLSVSGVSLDEEASDLLKFQAAYNASAKVVTLADELLETILAAV